MVIGKFALICSTEASFEGESVCNTHFFPHHHPGSGLFSFLYCEGAIYEVEYVAIFVHQAWEYPLFKPVIDSSRVPIHEDILFSRMAMQITKKKDIPIFLELLDHALHTGGFLLLSLYHNASHIFLALPLFLPL